LVVVVVVTLDEPASRPWLGLTLPGV
jgi:hypothetical protein